MIEDVSLDPDIIDRQSTLDTLYRLAGAGVPPPTSNPHNVVMTYYHGPPPQESEILFSGFSLWHYNRSHLEQLIDFVLQDLWGLPKAPLPPAARATTPQTEPANR